MTTKKTLKQSIIEVSPELMAKIINLSEGHKYTVDSHLYYEGQTPIVAYLLIAGEASLVKKRRKTIPIRRGSIFGLKELIQNEKSIYGAVIKSHSEVCFLDRSLINEIENLDKDHELKEILFKFKNQHAS